MSDLLFSTPECVAPVRALLGEGPVWEPTSARLFWVDIKGMRLFAFNSATGDVATFATPAMISALGLAKKADFVCAREDGFHLLRIDGANLRFVRITDPEEHIPGNRFNDGKTDPHGAFWAGTMDNAEKKTRGAWWRLTPDGAVDPIVDGFHVTNGPAFDPERLRVYLTDSAKAVIYASTEDAPAALRPFLQFENGDGYPDGMDVDCEGCLWVAFWDGGCIRRFSPDGKRLCQIDLPVQRPTSLAVVDDAIYVTSASIGLSADELAANPQAGGLFRIQLNKTIGRGKPHYFDDAAISAA